MTTDIAALLRLYGPKSTIPEICAKAADEIERLRAERDAALREALEWYGEQARLARLIHSEGDSGRHALSEDGGKRARAALSPASRSTDHG